MTTTTTAPTSAHNPFRSPAATPNPTGPPGPSSSPPRPGAATPPRSAAASRNTPEATGLDEELPPAYTPGPDVRHGETTVEYGPQRPFQPAPAPAPAPPRSPDPHPQPQYRPPPTSPPSIPTYSAYQNQHQHQHQNQTIPSIRRQLAALTTQLTGLAVHGVSSLSAGTTSRLSPQPTVAVTGSSWAGYPGQQQRLHPHYTSPAAAPPPLPPRRASISTSDPVSPAPLSDFARDFYAHGPADPDSPSSSSPAPPEDSGRPTTSPKPGRALLRDGKLLVYPAGYTCPKCRNVGYKHADPSHPCKRCWAKYARPFSGPLAFAFARSRSSEAERGETETETETQSNYQRPLPAFRPPQHTSHARSHSSPPPPPLHPARPSPSSSFHPSPPPPPPRPQLHIPLHPPPPPPPPRTPLPLSFSPFSPLPPPPLPPPPRDPNAIVYPAGDARLGGRLCWGCGGRGRERESVLFLVWEAGTCAVCAGVGRVY